MKHSISFILSFAALILSAGITCNCQQMETPTEGGLSGVSATANCVTDSKASVLSSVPNTFTLFACKYTGATPTGIDYIYKETMTKSGSQWSSANKFPKVSSDYNVKYFAVYPSTATGLTLPSASTAGNPVFVYSNPLDAANQNDIIVAAHDYSGSQANISLTFSHLLTAVDFKFASGGAFNGTIKSISISGLNQKGNYTLGTGWSSLSTPGTVSQTLNKAVTEGMGGSAITTSSNVMMFIPQTAGSGAMLNMVVNDGEKDIDLTCSLSGEKFDAGKEYTITLDLSGCFANLIVIQDIDITDWVNAHIGQAPTKKSEPVFTVDDKGTQVIFSPGNLWYDGSEFHFEEHQYDNSTSWNASHLGFFHWSKNKDEAVARYFSDKEFNNMSISDKLFACNGGAIEGYTVLSKDEWEYLFNHAMAENSSTYHCFSIAGNECIILKPDGFNETISDSYSAEEWATVEQQYGLVALPINLTISNSFTKAEEDVFYGGSYWSSTPCTDKNHEHSYYHAYCESIMLFQDGYDNFITFETTEEVDRDGSLMIRLVKPINLSASYDVSNQTDLTLPTATFSSGTVAAIDWGDGDIEVKTRPSGGEVTLSHTYASAYTGKVKINVKEGCVDFGKMLQHRYDRLSIYEGEKVKKELSTVPGPLLQPFTVSESGKKVYFAKGNLYWDGSKFAFEANQYDYPTSWNANHIGHFFWTKSKDVAIASSYSDGSPTITDTFFAANGGAIYGYTVLSQTEWDYLFSNALAKNPLSNNRITIAGKNCIVLKPDGFSETVADSYTAEQWATVEEQFGLVALPFAGRRLDASFYDGGSYGAYWSGTPLSDDASRAYGACFTSSDASTDWYNRDLGYSVRLVSVQ